MFKGKKGEGKRADYVIIADMNGKKRIVYVEMKNKKSTATVADIVKQFKGAICFVRYCQAVGKYFWNQKGFLNGYDERFVCMVSISMSKRPTRTKHLKGKHDSPDKMLCITSPNNEQFAKLAC